MAEMMFLTFSFIIILTPSYIACHARLMEPPSRSSMWRVGFATKRNFNDNALYCGGVQIQWSKNGGKCGICGDPWDMPRPRPNEAGGVFGKGIISRKYVAGQVVKAMVDVTTNHRGYFEFRICPNNNSKKEATQECLNQHILKIVDSSGTRYDITNKGSGKISVNLQLPAGMTCKQCVLQWTYVAGNNWGRCSNGSSGLGCGPQETFRGCSDIAIENSSGLSNNPTHFPSYPNYNRVKNTSPKWPNSIFKSNKYNPFSGNTIYQSSSSKDFLEKKKSHFSNHSPTRGLARPVIPPLFQKRNLSRRKYYSNMDSKLGLRQLTFT